MPSNQWEVYQCPVTGKYYDPFRTLASLHHYAADKLNELIRASEADPNAALQLATVGRRTFKLDPVDPATGYGVPDAAVLKVIEAFAEYVRGKGSGAGNWRSWSSPSVDPPQPSAPTTCSPCGLSAVALRHLGAANSPTPSR